MKKYSPLFLSSLLIVGVVWYAVQSFSNIQTTDNNTASEDSISVAKDWITVPYLGNKFQFLFAYPADWYYENRPYFWNLSHEGYENHFISVRQNRSLIDRGISFSIRWYDATNEDLDTWVAKKYEILKGGKRSVLPIEGFTRNEIQFRRICIDPETLLQPNDVHCFIYAEKDGIVLEAETRAERQTTTLDEIRSYSKAFGDRIVFLESPTDQWQITNGAGLTLRVPSSSSISADAQAIFIDSNSLLNSAIRITSEPSEMSPIEWWFLSEYSMSSTPMSIVMKGFECIFFHLFEDDGLGKNKILCNINSRNYTLAFGDEELRKVYSILNTLRTN